MTDKSDITQTRRLPWDSNFFGFNVSQVNLKKGSDLNPILSDLYKSNVKLVYVFSKNEISDEKCIFDFNGLLADIKITYSKLIKNLSRLKMDLVNDYNSEFVSNELLSLALSCGEYSRFKIDVRLPGDSYFRMYRIWIENSVNKLIADKVLVFRDKCQVQGFVTVKLSDLFSKIGLIAVSPIAQGKGIGESLLKKAEDFSLNNRLSTIKVSTQASNIKACTFYEKNGYKIEEKLYIYHFINNSC